jgi:hypothetical protein
LVNRRDFEGPPNGKHNTICKVSFEELNNLIAKWGNPKFQRIKSYNAPEKFIHHKNSTGIVDISVVDPMVDSKWRVVAGLADPDGISFESVSRPNYYLRQSNSSIVLNANDNSASFKGDATFYKVKGLADTFWSSFRAYTASNKYLRHSSNNLRIDSISTDVEKQDATFKVFYDTTSKQIVFVAVPPAIKNIPASISAIHSSSKSPVKLQDLSHIQVFDMPGKIISSYEIEKQGIFSEKDLVSKNM